MSASPTALLANDTPAGALIQDRVEVNGSANGQSGTVSRSSQFSVAYPANYYQVLEIRCGMGDRLPINGADAFDSRYVPGETLDQVFSIRNREGLPLTVTGLRIVSDQSAFEDLNWGVAPGRSSPPRTRCSSIQASRSRRTPRRNSSRIASS